jgi:hypothetical protein
LVIAVAVYVASAIILPVALAFWATRTWAIAAFSNGYATGRVISQPVKRFSGRRNVLGAVPFAYKAET